MIIGWLGLETILLYLRRKTKNKKAFRRRRGLGFLKFVFSVLFGIWCLEGGNSCLAENLIPRIDFEEAPVISVVQTLAKSAGLDLVLSGDQSAAQAKKATIHLKDVTAEEAIDCVLRTNGFNYERKGAILLVSLLPNDLNSTAYKPEIKAFPLKYLAAGKTSELLAKVIPSAVFQPGGRANLLVVRGRKAEMEEVESLLSKIDKLTPQVLIESRVIEVAESDSKKLGFSYGNGAFKFITSKDTKKTSPAEDLITVVNTLISDGKANVVASPRIATLDNQEAIINIGSRIPYAVPVSGGAQTQWTVDYIDAGVKLKITPQVGEEKNITTFIQPEVSSISEWRTTSAGDFPVISTRNASATLRVKDGETIVVGGLLSEFERENIVRFPVLGYLPLVGLLFQNRTTEKEKTEIVFLITPHII